MNMSHLLYYWARVSYTWKSPRINISVQYQRHRESYTSEEKQIVFKKDLWIKCIRYSNRGYAKRSL